MGDPLTLLASLAFVVACFLVIIPVVVIVGRLLILLLAVTLIFVASIIQALTPSRVPFRRRSRRKRA